MKNQTLRFGALVKTADGLGILWDVERGKVFFAVGKAAYYTHAEMTRVRQSKELRKQWSELYFALLADDSRASMEREMNKTEETDPRVWEEASRLNRKIVSAEARGDTKTGTDTVL